MLTRLVTVNPWPTQLIIQNTATMGQYQTYVDPSTIDISVLSSVQKSFLRSCNMYLSNLFILISLNYGNNFQLIPWKHFGRKNVGFLFAIAHGI